MLKKLVKFLAHEISEAFASFNLQVLKSCSNGHSTVSSNKKSKDWHLYIFIYLSIYLYIRISIQYVQFLHKMFSGITLMQIQQTTLRPHWGNLFDRRRVFSFDPFFVPPNIPLKSGERIKH